MTPALELPERPVLLDVAWLDMEGGLHCLTDEKMRKLVINVGRLRAQIEILEGVIRAVSGGGHAQ